jgi:hypothetical protein
MEIKQIFWGIGLIALTIFVVKALRGQTRAWRRKRKYRRQIAKAQNYWASLNVVRRPKDKFYVIATLTTSPERIRLIEPVLQALTSGQTRPPDEIHLNIPHRFARTGEEYVLPDFLKNYPVKIFRTEDEGPGTKLIPTIRRMPAGRDIWFFIVDDDVRHLPEALATLLDNADQRPEEACGYADNYLYRRWSPKNGEVDILCGFAGFIVHRSFFSEDFEAYLSRVLTNKSCRFHDDVYFSNYLALKNIPRVRIATEEVSLNRMEELGCLLEQGGDEGSLALGGGSGENTQLRSERAMDYLRSINLAGFGPK